MRRRPQPESPRSHERWLVSYADFITLLFAFFTTLYAISVVDAQKAERLVRSIRESFGQGIFDSGSGEPDASDRRVGLSLQLGDRPAAAGPADVENTRLGLLGARAREVAAALDAQEGIRVQTTERGLVISLAETAFFEPGGSRLQARSQPVMAKLAEHLRGIPNHVRVEGHTDDVPIVTPEFPSNWHLSTARAVSVVLALQDAGVPAYRLSASGFADQRPLVSNGTPEGRRLNRRIEIVVLRTLSTDSGA